jgi:hypothetical protein
MLPGALVAKENQRSPRFERVAAVLGRAQTGAISSTKHREQQRTDFPSVPKPKRWLAVSLR